MNLVLYICNTLSSISSVSGDVSWCYVFRLCLCIDRSQTSL